MGLAGVAHGWVRLMGFEWLCKVQRGAQSLGDERNTKAWDMPQKTFFYTVLKI
jgi:hypothetical protein